MAARRVGEMGLEEVQEHLRQLLAVRLGRELTAAEKAVWDRLVAREKELTGGGQEA